MTIDPKEVEAVVAMLEQLSDRLAMRGQLVDSGVVLMARQSVRALWTQMAPPTPADVQPPPAL